MLFVFDSDFFLYKIVRIERNDNHHAISHTLALIFQKSFIRCCVGAKNIILSLNFMGGRPPYYPPSFHRKRADLSHMSKFCALRIY